MASQTPLDKKVSCEIVRAPLQEVVSTLGKQAGVDIKVAIANRDYNSTVYVKDRPLKQVLDALALVHGLSVDASGSSIRLIGTSFRAEQDTYVKQEDSLLWNQTLAKISALAELTDKPYMSNPVGTEAKEEQQETAADWAKRQIHKWPYYLLGMWYRTASRYSPHLKGRLNLFKPMVYVGFWVHPPGSKAEIEEANAWMDENSASLRGRQMAFYVSPVSNEIRVAGVDPALKADPCRPFPYVYASPPAFLGNTVFAKRLASWITPPNKLDSEELGKGIKEGETPDPEKWYGDRVSLATVLQSFHRQTGIDVVADAYRIAVRTSSAEIPGRTGKEWIRNLVEKEGCFTRYEPGLLMVRHPAFWRLQQTEPSNASLKWLEAIAARGRPKIPDYAEFMAANNYEIQVRFDSASTCLTRFDPTPIQESGPAYWMIGRIPMQFKNAFLNGELYSVDHFTEGAGRNTDQTGSWLTARFASIYGASVTGICKLMLRQGPPRHSYAMLMGYDSLVKPSATEVYRFARLSMSPGQLSGELRMGFEEGGDIVYRLNVP